jgi:hypothetical protein
MPFNSSYRDFDKLKYLNARDCFRNLAGIIVRDPLSTHLIKTATRRMEKSATSWWIAPSFPRKES